jgi:5-formyltetrahydrofolate cyclo-ligase
MTKGDMRKEMRARRRAVSADERAEASADVPAVNVDLLDSGALRAACESYDELVG